jgi:hypothetical protein
MSRTELLTAAYEAFNRRDVDRVLALMSSDVNWPNPIEGTRAIGHNQVRAYWTGQWAVVNPQVKPIGIGELDDNRAIVHVHQVVRDLSGKVLVDQIVDHVYTFDGDLIRRMDIRYAKTGGASEQH